MTKAERAIKALREAADALDAMPFRRMNVLFGRPMLETIQLRNEADYIEKITEAYKEANTEVVS